MIPVNTFHKPPFNDALYQALRQYPAHTIEHYERKPLVEIGERMKRGLPDQRSGFPKRFNLGDPDAAR